jgi:hypothetical protein
LLKGWQRRNQKTKKGSVMNMHSNIIMKQILDFNKVTFDKSFIAVTALQVHSEKMIESFIENAHFFPEEGKELIKDWMNLYKNNLNSFRDAVDSRFKTVEGFLQGALPPSEFFSQAGNDPEHEVSAVDAVKKTGKSKSIDDKSSVTKVTVKKKQISINDRKI